MKKGIFSISVMGILVMGIMVLSLFIFNGKKDYIFIGENECFFGMTKKQLEDELGEPNDMTRNSADTSIDEYVYLTEILDHKATYRFYFLKSRLIEMNVSVENIEYDGALSMVEKCINDQKKYYSDQDGYYNSEIETTNNTNFVVSNGVNYGATGISFDYEYMYDRLIISAIKQE